MASVSDDDEMDSNGDNRGYTRALQQLSLNAFRLHHSHVWRWDERCRSPQAGKPQILRLKWLIINRLTL